MNNIVTVDLDGTLLNNENKIIGGKKTEKLIKKIQKYDVEFIVNTGRLDHDIINVTSRYNLPNNLRVSQNGAVVVDKSVMTGTLINKNEALKFWRYARNSELRIELNTISNRYWTSERPKDFVEEFYKSEIIIDDFESIIEYQPAILFLVIGEGDKITNIRKYVEETFFEIQAVQTSETSLEILPKNVSKGSTLRKLFPEERIFAIGDAENDHSIFEIANYSYYVKNQKHSKATSVKSIVEALELILKIIKERD